MKKIAVFCLSLLICLSIHAEPKWVEINRSNDIKLYADDNSFEETKTIDLIPAVTMNYKISTNNDDIGTIIALKKDCEQTKGGVTLGYYIPEKVIRPFFKGDFKITETIAFNTQDKTGLNPLVAKMCDLIPSWKKLVYKAQNGDAQAQMELGYLYRLGGYYGNNSIEKDEVKAFAWFEKAAALNNSDAQDMLGRFYFNGWSQPQNTPLAIAWYEKASNQGNMQSKVSLANIYKNEQGVAKNIEKADKLIAEVKASNDEYAIMLLSQNENYKKPGLLDLETIIIAILSLGLENILMLVVLFISAIIGIVVSAFSSFLFPKKIKN